MRCGIGTSLLGLIFLAASANCAADYCKITCNGVPEGRHTMCLFPKTSPGPNCTEYEAEKSVLSQETKDEILDQHNKMRNKVAIGDEKQGNPGPQPPAANMMELVWDKELEEIALRHALQCIYKHDECRSTADGQPAGQNLGITAGTYGIDPHMKGFYGEVKDLPPGVLKSFRSDAVQPPKKVGHYTQLVWATTSKVGCALSHFMYTPFEKAGKAEMLVCNYSPAGNFLNEKVYEEGKQCSKCPSGLKCSTKYPGLCANPESKLAGDQSTTTVGPPPDAGNVTTPVAGNATGEETTPGENDAGNATDITEPSGDPSDPNPPEESTVSDDINQIPSKKPSVPDTPEGVNDKEKECTRIVKEAGTAKSGADPSLKQTVLARRKFIFMHALLYLLT